MEKLSDKDALYLYATEPDKLQWVKTKTISPCYGHLSVSEFLTYWRKGEIVLCPEPKEPTEPVPVRVPVKTNEHGWTYFNLPACHKSYYEGKASVNEAPSFGGVPVYHLPDGQEIKCGIMPIWWDDVNKIYYLRYVADKGYNKCPIWPDEIEFSPDVLKEGE